MTSEKVKSWLSSKGDLSSKDLNKCTQEDKIIIAHIISALDGSTQSFKLLHDMTYGVLKPGEGPNKTEKKDESFKVIMPGINDDE